MYVNAYRIFIKKLFRYMSHYLFVCSSVCTFAFLSLLVFSFVCTFLRMFVRFLKQDAMEKDENINSTLRIMDDWWKLNIKTHCFHLKTIFRIIKKKFKWYSNYWKKVTGNKQKIAMKTTCEPTHVAPNK